MQGIKLNLLLVIAVVLLGAIAIYEPGLKKAEEPQSLLPLSADEVNEITVRNGGQRTIILKRDAEKVWQMVEPLQIAANPYKVDSVLAILKQQPTNRFFADTEKLASYGLQNPQVELVLNGSQKLIFGKQTPLNNYRYLQIADAVATIKDVAYYPVASLYTNFIASRLLPDGVAMASIQLPDFRVAFNQGQWTIESSNEALAIKSEASADQIAQWLDGWRYASSINIKPIADNTQNEKQDEVIITLQSGERLRWTISAKEDGFILGRPDLGIEYHLSKAQREIMLSPPQPELEPEPEPEPEVAQ